MSNKVALITGGSRGIGAEIARRFAEAGWDLLISARGVEALEEKAGELREAHGVKVIAVPADQSEAEEVAHLGTEFQVNFDRLDALVLNAGMGNKGAIEDFPSRRLDRLYEVNLRAPFLLIQQLLPLLRSTAQAHGAAKVIAVSSITGVYPEPELSAYGATKAALLSLCETFNLEESERGVSATAIAPGYVDTDMSGWTGIPPEEMISAGDVATLAVAVTELSRYAVLPNLVLTRPGTNLHRA